AAWGAAADCDRSIGHDAASRGAAVAVQARGVPPGEGDVAAQAIRVADGDAGDGASERYGVDDCAAAATAEYAGPGTRPDGWRGAPGEWSGDSAGRCGPVYAGSTGGRGLGSAGCLYCELRPAV